MAEALGLAGGRTASWADGISAVYQARPGQRGTVFLTPPVDGWTLAVLGGGGLPWDGGTGDGPLDLASLSSRFGEVQKFSTHRVVEYHEWQRWAGGMPVRRYCWIGESGTVRFDEGRPGRAEGNLPRPADLDAGDWDAFDFPGEDTVMAVAADWSIDPTTLEERSDLPPAGFLGFLPRAVASGVSRECLGLMRSAGVRGGWF